MERYSYVRRITMENNALMLNGIELMRIMAGNVGLALLIILVPSRMFKPQARSLASATVCMYVEVLVNLAVLHNRYRTIRDLAVALGYYDALRLEGLMK